MRDAGNDSSAFRLKEGVDPLAGLRKYLEHGGTLRKAAELTGVPRTTLQRYLAHGLPPHALDLLSLVGTFRKDGRIRN